MLIGATWTIGGAAPTQVYGLPKCFFGSQFCAPDNIVGASQLFNSTMETYDQGGGTTFIKNNGLGLSCFDYHGGDGGLAPSNISHIFGIINATSVPNQVPE